MKRAEKEKIMSKAGCEFDRAKHSLDRAAEILAENGLYKDAETLMRMVYRIEEFQTKYDEFRI